MKDRIGWIKQLSPVRCASLALLAGYTCAGLWIYKPERGLLSKGPLTEIDQAILHASNVHNVEVRLLEAVAMQETRMDPDAVGKAGEIGLFQIMPNTAKHWSEETGNPILTQRELFDPYTNAEIAAWYLRKGLDRFRHRKRPTPFALAFYNAGPSRAVKWEKNLPEDMTLVEYIPFPSTRKYVTNILQMYRNPVTE